MPGLNGGNTCWGNRKSFNMYGEYIGDSFFGLDFRENEIMRSSSRNSSNTITFTSSNIYHGYHRILNSVNHDETFAEMSVDNTVDQNQTQITVNDGLNSELICRKRPNLEQNCAIVKRFRHNDTRGNSHSYNNNSYKTSYWIL